MDYQQARAFLNQTARYGSVYGLAGIRSLMARLGDVQKHLRIIHVAGTNGKGSVCAMLASILKTAGYRTGVYSSPAVFEPEEIIRVNGDMISQEKFASLTQTVQVACMDMRKEGLPHPTAFEVETAIAFCYFYQEHCDLVLLETGLGGAQDATNLIAHPVCSVISQISRDHMALLGQTLEEIAAQKAGIIKAGCPCVSSAQPPQVLEVLKHTAEEKGSPFLTADSSCIRHFSYDGTNSLFETETLRGTLALSGACQKENLSCVLAVAQVLQEQGIRLTQEDLLKGLSSVRLAGRLEKIADGPDIYIDGAHNEGAAYYLRETVRSCFAGRKVVYIIGVFADKEYEKLLEIMLPYAAQVITVTPPHSRALDGKKLAETAEKLHPAVVWMPDMAQAVSFAKAAAGSTGVVLAFGSFSYLAGLKTAVQRQTADADDDH